MLETNKEFAEQSQRGCEFAIVRNSMVKSLYDVLEVDYLGESFTYVAKAQSFEQAQNIFDQCSEKQETAV